MPTHVLATGTPFANPSGIVGTRWYDYMQWLYDVDYDGAILDHRGILSRPVYTGNNCKKFNGVGDCFQSTFAVNVGTKDFAIGLVMRLDSILQDKYGNYYGRWMPDGVDFTGNVAIHQSRNTVYFIAKSHEGEHIAFGNTATRSLGTTLFHTYEIRKVGDVMTAYIDGAVCGSATFAAGSTFLVNRVIEKTVLSGPCTYSHAWVDIAGVRVQDLTFAEGPCLTGFDRCGNHINYTTTSGIDTMATTDDGAMPWNILNGFSLYTHATLDPIRVPYDANGDPLSITPPTGYTLASEHPGGRFHNGAESTITQTDDYFIDGPVNFYSADGATQYDKTYADFLAHEPFKYNLLLQWKSVGGVCLGCEAMQLPLTYTWTKAKYNAALALMHKFTSDCGAKIFTVTEPAGGWLRTFDPNTATAGEAYDFLATLVHDLHTGFQTYAVTEPTGGWVRTFDSMDEDLTLWTVQDVLATVAHDIGSAVKTYTLNTGGTELYTFDPNTATFDNAKDVLYSLMIKLEHFGFIL